MSDRRLKTKEEYLDFLRAKMPRAEKAGFEPPSLVSPSLFPHQRDVSASSPSRSSQTPPASRHGTPTHSRFRRLHSL